MLTERKVLGTAELVVLSRPFGTWHTRAPVPALKRWAIFSQSLRDDGVEIL